MAVKHSKDVEAKNVAAGKETTIQVLISSQEGPNFALRKFSCKREAACRVIQTPWNTSNTSCAAKRRSRSGGDASCQNRRCGFHP